MGGLATKNPWGGGTITGTLTCDGSGRAASAKKNQPNHRISASGIGVSHVNSAHCTAALTVEGCTWIRSSCVCNQKSKNISASVAQINQKRYSQVRRIVRALMCCAGSEVGNA